jgi:hypothetical protein
LVAESGKTRLPLPDLVPLAQVCSQSLLNVPSLPYTRRLIFLNITISGLQHWTVYLPQHAIPATPEDLTGRFESFEFLPNMSFR